MAQTDDDMLDFSYNMLNLTDNLLDLQTIKLDHANNMLDPTEMLDLLLNLQMILNFINKCLILLMTC